MSEQMSEITLKVLVCGTDKEEGDLVKRVLKEACCETLQNEPSVRVIFRRGQGYPPTWDLHCKHERKPLDDKCTE